MKKIILFLLFSFSLIAQTRITVGGYADNGNTSSNSEYFWVNTSSPASENVTIDSLIIVASGTVGAVQDTIYIGAVTQIDATTFQMTNYGYLVHNFTLTINVEYTKALDSTFTMTTGQLVGVWGTRKCYWRWSNDGGGLGMAYLFNVPPMDLAEHTLTVQATNDATFKVSGLTLASDIVEGWKGFPSWTGWEGF